MKNADNFIRLEEIIWHMPGCVYWKDSEGVYRGCNQNQIKALNLHKIDDVVGKTAKELIKDPLLAATIEKIDREVMTSGNEFALEEGPLYSNENLSYYFTRKIPLHNSAGKVIGLLGISLDITERKMLEQDLLKAKETAEAANRTKTEFLANMSHDIKSPMTGIVTFAQLMMTDSQWRTPEKAEKVHASALEVLSFFNSCLELSKLETSEFTSQPTPFCLPDLLEEIRALFIPQAQSKGLHFAIECSSNLPKNFIGHRGSLYRIILNLVGNAVKFTDKGEVIIRTFIADHLSHSKIKLGIEVKDSGPGIPEDKHQIIFEKLHRLTPSYEGKIEGSGIGLYIVHKYIKHIDGEIRVASELGKGSTFTIIIPTSITSELNVVRKQSLKQKNAPRIITSHNPMLLLVEDNPMIQIATKSLLEKAGFRVDVAISGEDALRVFLPEKYSFIFMDIGLPDCQGYEVAANIRRKEKELNSHKNVPIIALTAHGALDIETFCSDAGMQGILTKPITPEKIDSIWRRYGLGENTDVPGLTSLYHTPKITQEATQNVEKDLPILDLLGTIKLVGSEEQAYRLFKFLGKELSEKYLNRFAEMIQEKNYSELRKDLHGILGALCYAKAPRLNRALLALKEATHSISPTISQHYQDVKNEAEQYQAAVNLL